MSATTPLPFEVFKARMDFALQGSYAARAMTATWFGPTLEITAPGCRASGTFEKGRFCGLIQLTGAVIFMRRAIFTDLERMLRVAGCVDIRLEESDARRIA